jgi:DoxX-like family
VESTLINPLADAVHHGWLDDVVMSSRNETLPPASRMYWAATGLFTALFLGSAVWTFIDIPGAEKQARDLNFPTNLTVPLAIAKVLGLIAILSNKSKTLKTFAFAGFLFDLLLALSGHLTRREAYSLVAVAGLVIWTAAFIMDRKRFGTAA